MSKKRRKSSRAACRRRKQLQSLFAMWARRPKKVVVGEWPGFFPYMHIGL